MDGVTQVNYALWPTEPKKVKNVTAGTQIGVGALGAQYPEVGTAGRPAETGAQQPGVRPEDAGAKIISSVDGDTVTISAEGQAYVQQAAASADGRDVTSATARAEDEGSAFGQPFGQPFGEDQAETFFNLPQGGGIERADFEQPQVQQIQDAAIAEQDTERVEAPLQPQEEEPVSALDAAPEEDAAAEGEVRPSDFRQYFNSELRQMLYRGQITQQQYDDEIESRQTENDMKIDKKML